MSLIAMLIGGLRVLLRAACMFLTLGMIALAVVFGSRPVRLGGVFVIFGSFVVFISRHFSLVRCELPAGTKSRPPESFLPQISTIPEKAFRRSAGRWTVLLLPRHSMRRPIACLAPTRPRVLATSPRRRPVFVHCLFGQDL